MDASPILLSSGADAAAAVTHGVIVPRSSRNETLRWAGSSTRWTRPHDPALPWRHAVPAEARLRRRDDARSRPGTHCSLSRAQPGTRDGGRDDYETYLNGMMTLIDGGT